eukprot:scaffold57350_cov69-Phaeocystis_antarctica.AAC.5
MPVPMPDRSGARRLRETTGAARSAVGRPGLAPIFRGGHGRVLLGKTCRERARGAHSVGKHRISLTELSIGIMP